MTSKILQKLKHCLFLATILFSFTSSAQCDGRYQAEIFTSTTKISDVNYSDVFFDNEHKMDIYLPDGDTATNRPVIIFIHGGSFYAGDKTQTDCEDFCRAFAKRGYVTASVNYRLVSFINIANLTIKLIWSILILKNEVS